MHIPEAALAMGKLALIFILLLALLRFRIALWAAILAGGLLTALITGIDAARWPGIIFNALTHKDFLFLVSMVFLIQVLSGVQEASGQNTKMVRGLERYMRSPRLRLVLFPALVGLLPMPGGALFSCPMVAAASEGMGVTNEKKALINYWFRHIWELAWPLYPGYVLVCALLDIPLTRLWLYTFPLVFLAFGVGWFFYMRELAESRAMAEHERALAAGSPGESLTGVLLHGLPIAVVLLGAGAAGLFFGRFFPSLPGQSAFCAALAAAVAVALYQGRREPMRPLREIAFTPNSGRTFLLLAAIFIFKDTVIASGLITSMSRAGDSGMLLVLTFILVPFASGLLTGLMVGFVGLCFPILIEIARHSIMQEYLLPLVVLALVTGNCGQMLSPVHVCLVVTCESFATSLSKLLRVLAVPMITLGILGSLWVAALFLAGARV